MADADRLSLIASVAASYLRRNSVGVDQIGSVISSVTRALEAAANGTDAGAGAAGAAVPAPQEKRPPAVAIKDSVHGDYIVCLDCGIHARTLKRHLQAAHGATPQLYREKWNLPKDYPVTAPSYSERRSQMAKRLGLGRKVTKGQSTKRRGRKRA
jgi:predicted transcriptional regulator